MKEKVYSSSLLPAESAKFTHSIRENQNNRGFAKVVAGGRIVRLRNEVPFYERLVTGQPALSDSKGLKSKAILESVTSNLEAGINMVDRQETILAKIGGRLSDIALSLNKSRDPNLSHQDKNEAQQKFIKSRDYVRNAALTTYDNTALFSNGPAKPVTVAVPSGSKWEGISVDRINLSQPSLITIDKGKVYGDGPGYTLDPGTIKRAFHEWRELCVSNSMQYSLLADRLHGIRLKLDDLLNGMDWHAPRESISNMGPLSRPHLQN